MPWSIRACAMTETALATPAAGRSLWGDAWARLKANKAAYWSAIYICVITLLCVESSLSRAALSKGLVVVSSSSYNASRRDIVIMAITSQVHQPLGFGEALLIDWQSAGLIKTSVLKPVFTTIEQGLVIRTMGAMSAADSKTLREVVAEVLG